MMNAYWVIILVAVHYAAAVPAQEGRSKRQIQRQQPQQRSDEEAKGFPNCDFGKGKDLESCGWNTDESILQWVVSKGENAFWLGGPTKDVTEKDNQGGYVVFETSSLPERTKLNAVEEKDAIYQEDHASRDRINPQGPRNKKDREFMKVAKLTSPRIQKTGPTGTCLNFNYRIEGLSASQMRVYLRRVYEEKEREDIEKSAPQKGLTVGNDVTEEQKNEEHTKVADNIMIWQHFDQTNDVWMRGEKLYSFPDNHELIFEAVCVDESNQKRDFRGYIALDAVKFGTFSDCQGHCTFDGSFCSWQQNIGDDNFDWSLGRGSRNEATGPKTDHGSEMFDSSWGGYAFIDSSYPRRYLDKARLESKTFTATRPDMPLCMRFWAHMFGSGIGSLKVIYQPQDNEEPERVIWQISGDQGRRWHEGHVPVASKDSFKIVFEGVIERQDLGNIAIDDISFTPGACVTSPQGANPSSGDCDFNGDECSFVNPSPNEQLDDLDWQRSVARSTDIPSGDHRSGMSNRKRPGAFMNLLSPKGGLSQGGKRGWFMSQKMQGGEDLIRCVSFWYFMNEPYISSSGPSLGSLRVYIRSENDDRPATLEPLWHLDNHQGSSWKYGQAPINSAKDYQVVFEGMWASGRDNGIIAIDDVTFFEGKCTTMPLGAWAMNGDCSFTRDTCQWEDSSSKDFGSSNKNNWKAATISNRPANLPDHTYQSPTGYIYFDVLSLKTVTTHLVSPTIKTNADITRICITFWYAVFGKDTASELKLKRKPTEEGSDSVEELTVSMRNNRVYRPEWRYSQVAVDAGEDFKIIFSGSSLDGGFGLDDVRLVPGNCDTIENDDRDL